MASLSSQGSSSAEKRLAYIAELPAVFSAPVSVLAGAPAPADRALAAWLPLTHAAPMLSLGAAAGSAPTPTSPLRIGVVFCGRQCPGGHNVVAGLFDGLQALAPGSELVGFLNGTLGFFAKKHKVLTAADIAPFRNQGGYHLLGRSVDKIRTPAEQAAALAAATELRLDGLVLLGGTYTQTDAAYLAEAFLAAQSPCRVVGVPATIDGDLKGGAVEATLGFDTACKITAALVGNLETDCLSAKKYVYFARVLGRERGHVALEVALQTRPNVVLLGEDVAERRMTLMDVVRELADGIALRAEAGKNFAVVLVPEGLISYIPELRTLLGEINAAYGAAGGGPPQRAAVEAALSPWSAAVLASLPPAVAAQLFLERESSGEAQLSQIATERLLLDLVSKELAHRRVASPALKAKGNNGMGFFFGYQARSALPSNFDCALGGALGRTAVHLVAAGRTGYLAAVRNLAAPPAAWAPVGVPLASLLTVPLPGITCAAAAKPSVVATPVDVRGAAFRAFRAASAAWCTGDKYANPGPVQFGGPCAGLCTMTLEAEAQEGRR